MGTKNNTNAESGHFASFLENSKKDIVTSFYKVNSNNTNSVTGALVSGEMKSGLLYIVATLLSYLASANGLSVVELILNIVRIGSGAITWLTALGTLGIELLNYIMAKKEYKSLIEMVTMVDSQTKDIPVIFSSVNMENGKGELRVVKGNKTQYQAEIISVKLKNGTTVAVAVNDFMRRIIALEEIINYFPYEGHENDGEALYSLLQNYIEVQDQFTVESDGTITDPKELLFEQGLSDIETKVAQKLGMYYKQTIKSDGPKLTRGSSEEEN